MLILAGCSTTAQQSGPKPTTPEQITISTFTPTPIPTENSPDSVEYGKVTYYNATESEIQAVNETMVRFFEDLPENRTERTTVVAGMADTSCTAGTVNETLFTSTSLAHERGQQLYHVARLMRANYNSRINPARIRKVAQTSAEIGKYTTIVGTYNNYHKAACAFDRNDSETVEDYYLASATLGFELLMFQYGMYYKTAFRANRVLSHQRTYRVVQSTFGDEALGLMMSGSYWLVHGGLNAAPDFVREEADKRNLTLSQEATHPSQHQRVERFVGAEVIPPSVSDAATKCFNEVKKQNKSGDGLLGKTNDYAKNVGGDLLNGEYTVSEVLESTQEINPQELSEKQMKRVQNCIEKNNQANPALSPVS